MIANDGVVGSSKNDDEELPGTKLEMLLGRLGTGVFVRDIQTPSISIPLSNARIPKGASPVFSICALTIFRVGSRSLPSTVE
jgi:hypothetical protein